MHKSHQQTYADSFSLNKPKLYWNSGLTAAFKRQYLKKGGITKRSWFDPISSYNRNIGFSIYRMSFDSILLKFVICSDKKFD